MSCYHHPDASVILNAASGQLPTIHHLSIQLHAQVCETCQKLLSEFEQKGGENLQQLSDSPLVALTFSALLDKIGDTEQDSKASTETYDTQRILEDILMKGTSSDLNWHWRTRRFAEIPLSANDDNFEAKLIYFKKGFKVPQHTHKGDEVTIVLHGAFSDDSGTYKRGDYVHKTSLDRHSPIAESDCICLAITNAPLKFTGTFGPVLNWFMK